MDKHLLHKSGRGTLIAALSVVSSLALAQSAETAADTTGADPATARIQRGPATDAGSAGPAAQGAPLTTPTQGFVGGSESPSGAVAPTGSAADAATAPAATGSAANDSATIPAAPPPAPAASEQPAANPNPQGFVGGGASPSGPGVGPGNAAPARGDLDTSPSIWETRPGNSVTPAGNSGM